MKKVMFLLSAFVLIGSYGFAQTNGDNDSKGTDASVHGSTVSDLAQNTTVTGKQKGSLISSAARAKALLVANANAKFLRGDAKPSNANANAGANASTNANVNANANGIANANVNSALNASTGAAVNGNGQPSTLPPVSPPTTGQPISTPVGKPVGVPVAVQGAAHVGGH